MQLQDVTTEPVTEPEPGAPERANPATPVVGAPTGPSLAEDVGRRLLAPAGDARRRDQPTRRTLLCSQLAAPRRGGTRQTDRALHQLARRFRRRRLRVYDTMRTVHADVVTVCLGHGRGRWRSSCSARGHARAPLRGQLQPRCPCTNRTGMCKAHATDINIQAAQFKYMRATMARLIADHTGQPLDRIVADMDRDRWFTAREALDYGLVDHVIDGPLPL